MATHSLAHPSEFILKAFHAGKLDASGAGAVVSHLEACPGCQTRIATLYGDSFLKQLLPNSSASGIATNTHNPGGTLPTSSPAPSSVSPSPTVPPQLQRHQQYEVLRELGRGGMGVVYLAKNRLLDRSEVLKVVNQRVLDQPATAERFLREARSAAHLSHPNIVTAYAALMLDDLLVFAMECVDGEDLSKLVKARGPLPVANACYYIHQAALGLQHAFERGMVHRDIKPHNLILARDGKKHIVKILDFGLAKATREGESKGTDLTGSGQMLGTPDYIAPEQSTDAATADIRADIYSLGCTLYFLLTGRAPFQGNSVFQLLCAHQTMTATPLNEVRPEIPPALAAVVERMMAKNPDQRFQKPIEVAQVLLPFVKTRVKPLPAIPAGPIPAKSKAPSAPVSDVFEIPDAPPQDRSLPDTVPQKLPKKKDPTSPRSRWPLVAVLGAVVGVLALAGTLSVVLLAWKPAAVGSQTDPGANANRLSEEYVEYRKQVYAGRGSVVFLQKSAPTRYPAWRAEADAGNPIGQLFVGRCYQEGLVVGRDETAGVTWLEKSAAQGNDFAMHTLGLAYVNGQGVTVDAGKSLQWYTRAAEAGNIASMQALGGMYAGSAVGKPNPERAVEWYRKAADGGHPGAMRLLGNCYKYGTGVKADKAESDAWYTKAAAAGDAFTIGKFFGNRLAPHFSAYLNEKATPQQKATALAELQKLRGEYDQLAMVEIEAIYEASDLRNATTTLSDLKSDDPIRVFYNGLIQKYVSLYSGSSRSERVTGISSFSLATESFLKQQHEDTKYDAIAAFWTQAYKDISLDELKPTQELNGLIRALNWSTTALIRVGQRKEASQLTESVLALCDRSLKEHPWDWYMKDAYTGFCFDVAVAWVEVGEPTIAQPLLRRGWTVRLKQFDREDLLAKYSEMPLKGKAPSSATTADREFFEAFGPNADKSKSGIKRFTVPCDFSGTRYPFHLYVMKGKRGYAELQDQFRWLTYFRGGEVPVEVRDSFRRLNTIAVENNVDFMELCVYALGTVAEDEKIEQAIGKIIAKRFGVAADKIDKKKPLSAVLKMFDDLEEVELILAIEEEFNIKLPNTAIEKVNGNKKGTRVRDLSLEQLVKAARDCGAAPKENKK